MKVKLMIRSKTGKIEAVEFSSSSLEMLTFDYNFKLESIEACESTAEQINLHYGTHRTLQASRAMSLGNACYLQVNRNAVYYMLVAD